jgi:hypothetical protein
MLHFWLPVRESYYGIEHISNGRTHQPLDLFPLFTCYKVKRRLSRDPFPGYTVNMDGYRPMWHIKPCPCFPGFNFQSTWSHEYHSPWWNMVYGSLTVHWANSESRPAEDPVDSDHFPGSPPGATDGLIQVDFAVPALNFDRFLPPCLFRGTQSLANISSGTV